MASNSLRTNQTNASLQKNNQTPAKKGHTDFDLHYSNSSPQRIIKKQVTQPQTTLPINFFHSPGQYNKMLIQSGLKQKTNIFEQRMGVLRSLQFINDPIFVKQKQKKIERIKKYQQKTRCKSAKTKTNSIISKCACCCCDDFCKDCANTFYQKSENNIHQRKQEVRKNKWLIGIESTNKGSIKNTQRKQKIIQFEDSMKSCHSKNKQPKQRIQELINSTLIKNIQQKRNKDILHLFQQQKKNIIQDYNQNVRKINRNLPTYKSQKKSQAKPIKLQVRKAYWQSIKNLIASQLKKPKKEPFKKINHSECHERSKPSKSPEVINKLRLQRGRKAFNKIKKLSQQKSQKSKIKMKKLLALDAKQAIIMRNCKRNKFIPTEQMIVNAFTNIA